MSSGKFRLTDKGAVDYNVPINFSFNNKKYQGYRGDTLASALLANGVRLVARSFKYHRPRGIVAAGAEEPNALVTIGVGGYAEPNLKATQVELFEGLEACSSHGWPSLSFDLMAVFGLFGRFMPAGFYYKTFMWPNWHLFEPLIRKLAGLGSPPTGKDPDRYEHRYKQCDVLVIGGGLSGLAAAAAASEQGAEVLIIDDKPDWGGAAFAVAPTIEGTSSARLINDLVNVLKARSNVCMCSRTTALGYYDHNYVSMLEHTDNNQTVKACFWKVRASRVILASGAYERPLVFPHNDKPGSMLAGSVVQYIEKYGVLPGQIAVVATNNDTAYEAAISAHKAGIKIAAIADARPNPSQQVLSAMAEHGIRVYRSSVPTRLFGLNCVKAIQLSSLEDNGKISAKGLKIEADLFMMSGGWNPAVHLFSQSGGKLRFDEVQQAFIPEKANQNIICIGAAAGQFDAVKAFETAVRVGGNSKVVSALPACSGLIVSPLWKVSASSYNDGKSWVDFQNDVTAQDIVLAAGESFRSVEHLKRYTTLGMAVDQGKTSNVNAIGIMAGVLGKHLAEVGTTKFRPPFDSVAIGAVVGAARGGQFNPLRHMAAHDLHEHLGAFMKEYGRWSRPSHYPQHQEIEQESIAREMLAVRTKTGVFDASPLGKIEVTGPDAGEFLNRVYANTMKTLSVGQCRYGIMLNENGTVFDDGIVARLSENHYCLTTTSGGADEVTAWLREWLQGEWPELNTLIIPVTEQWSVMAVMGHQTRKLLSNLGSTIDFSKSAFPFMSVREGKIADVGVRVMCVSFIGELTFEIWTPAGYVPSLLKWLCDDENCVTPVGVEAVVALRLEKGNLIVGVDTDGMSQPQDIGFQDAIENKMGDFIGRRSLTRPASLGSKRLELVGLRVPRGVEPLQAGAHALAKELNGDSRSIGYVTSSAHSPTLGRSVALGLIAGGRQRIGERVTIFDDGTLYDAQIIAVGEYDREGDRLRA